MRANEWSEAKIQRWLADKRRVARREARARAERAESRAPELESWLSFLASVLLGTSGARRVSLLLHLYRGSLEGERIHIARREGAIISEATPDYLQRMQEDVLYDFARDRRGLAERSSRGR